MTTALMIATAGFLLSLLYLNGVVTAGDASCACQEKVNKALIQSLEGCTGALTAMEECNKELALNEAEEVKAEATGAATSTCKCAKEVTEALTKSLKSCVEALSETINCGGPPAPPSPPTPSPSPSSSPPPPPPPAKPTSCKEIYEKNPNSKNGKYTLYDPIAKKEYKTFCFMDKSPYFHNVPGFTEIFVFRFGKEDCPKGFVKKDSICCRPPSKSGGCVSFSVSSRGIKYDRVLSRVFAYQIGTPDGVSGSNRPGSIDEAYVDGVSITYGKSPRKHIWTFIASSSEKKPICPCSTGSTVKVPDFIGKNYFCESGNPDETAVPGKLYDKDKMWDGRTFGSVEASCSDSKDGHTYTVLPSSTTDDIEVRVCTDEATADEDIGLNNINLFVY